MDRLAEHTTPTRIRATSVEAALLRAYCTLYGNILTLEIQPTVPTMALFRLIRATLPSAVRYLH